MDKWFKKLMSRPVSFLMHHPMFYCGTEEEALVQSLSDVVLQMADKYVVASTASTGETTSTTGTTGRSTGTTGTSGSGSDHPQNFAKVVAQLWLFLGQWNYRAYDSATACVLKLMDKWAMPHIHQVGFPPLTALQVYRDA
jgi:hypothetical protein